MLPRLAAAALLVALHARAAAEPRPVRSMLELRKEHVVQQRWDLSCGAAALSTLLTHHLGDPVGEPEVVAALLAGVADPERIRRDGGFTLLDLKRYATARGYVAKGYTGLTLPALASLAPAIVATVVKGQPHFMIVRGVAEGRIVLSDPAYGNRTMLPKEFEATWSPKVAFVVRRPGGAPAAGVPPTATVVPDSVIRGVGRWTP